MPEKDTTMQSFDNAVAISAAPETVTDPELRKLLTDRVHDWTATGLLGLTHLLIVEPGDTEEAIVDAIGFPPLVSPLDGLRFGADGFVTPWDWLERHSGFFELIFTVGNDGFAFVLLIENVDGVDPELLSLCRAYAGD